MTTPFQAAVRLLRELLECAELNQDSLEPETAELLDEARTFLCEREAWEQRQ